ncbi:hypothetical protein BC629DRAFT_1590808 [Irpex lacteus]|nr:hypothetical protein BC629DRAFT_1590808 [Irpex lacteus]
MGCIFSCLCSAAQIIVLGILALVVIPFDLLVHIFWRIPAKLLLCCLYLWEDEWEEENEAGEQRSSGRRGSNHNAD